ncbi:MAG: DUF2721 domain-containing protein [Microscillaceae bacterium]
MDITITTPALLFPAVSLLLLGYGNRFLAIAALIRNLHSEYRKSPKTALYRQIRNLRKRMYLIRNAQAAGVLSLFLCVLCMYVLFEGYLNAGKYIFTVSLVLLMISLALLIWEIQISVFALELQLRDAEEAQEG